MFSASNYWATSPSVSAWQENLSNTAHQREMADYKAAGINPMLTAQTSGASTPSGSSEDFMSGMMNLLANTVSSSSKSMSKAVKSLSDAVKQTSTAAQEASEKPWNDFTNYTMDNPKTPIGAAWNMLMNLLENGVSPLLGSASQFIRNNWQNVVSGLASELPDLPNSGSGKDYDQRLPLQGSHSRKHGVSGSPFARAILDTFNSFGSYT